MESVVIRVDPARRQWWKQTIQSKLPNLKVVLLDEDEYDSRDIQYAIVWNPPMGMFKRFEHLKCVVSVGAGVSHILKDTGYPRHIPIIRCVNEALRQRMAEYILLHVLRFHKRLPEVQLAHNERQWRQVISPVACDITVGMMGMGNLGTHAAKKLALMGYKVAGWSRGQKELEHIKSFYGDDQLHDFLAFVHILVCTLPLTPKTRHILSRTALSALPAGSYLINVGRGGCLVDADLIELLDNGHLKGATLDVFNREPLPADHPFWSHKHILVTCHSAGIIDPDIGGDTIANNLKKFINGEPVADIVDIEQGY